MSDFNIEITPMGSVSESHYFRGLIMGSAHVGKTSCVLMTAPKPTFVINCDKQILAESRDDALSREEDSSERLFRFREVIR